MNHSIFFGRPFLKRGSAWPLRVATLPIDRTTRPECAEELREREERLVDLSSYSTRTTPARFDQTSAQAR
jgi:hypothetical protein